MPQALFYLEDSSLTPEARWLLWQWSRHIGLERAVTCSVRELLASLGMTLRQGQKALMLLKEQGAIIATPKPRGRGRSSYEYRLAPELQEKMATQSCPERPLMDVVERLGNLAEAPGVDTLNQTQNEPTQEDQAQEETAHDSLDENDASLDPSDPLVDIEANSTSVEAASPPLAPDQASHANLLDGASRKASLTLVNRWVLMVLFAHADENGTVMGLGHARLQRLTGLSLSRLQSQRRKLFDHGVLARYQPGRAGRVLGHRLHSIYHLDLDHPSVRSTGRPVLQLELLPSRTDTPDTSLCEVIVDAMFMAVRTAGNPDQREDYQRARLVLPRTDYATPPWDIVRALPFDREVTTWLRVYVHRAATQLLNIAWQPLKEWAAGPDTPVNVVMEDLHSALSGSRVAGSEAAPDDAQDVTPEQASASETNHKVPLARREGEYAALAKLLYALAHHIAKELQQNLLPWQDCNPDATLKLDTLTYRLSVASSAAGPEGKIGQYWRLSCYESVPDSAPENGAPHAREPVVLLVMLDCWVYRNPPRWRRA
ncbi:hypothetical protein [Halomonas korlensis]|uniref:Uncharacterized protein n=1 Tax=Halomonas korlensis TaxID=463301 RepID=A0A1I7GKQ7_9GAMM|nr:hypothetical protein [Halomonas korlensis]SFU49023.1 hypothetical protein SAMN04487955_10380 [Halomonas korlensis]